MAGKHANPPIVEDTTSQIKKVLNSLLKNRIVIPKPDEVRDYLMHYPDITGLLLPVCELTRQQFGSQVQLAIEVYHDPEIEDEYLTLYVRPKKYDADIMKRIKEIRAKHERKLVGKSGWFLVTTDFRPPR